MFKDQQILIVFANFPPWIYFTIANLSLELWIKTVVPVILKCNQTFISQYIIQTLISHLNSNHANIISVIYSIFLQEWQEVNRCSLCFVHGDYLYWSYLSIPCTFVLLNLICSSNCMFPGNVANFDFFDNKAKFASYQINWSLWNAFREIIWYWWMHHYLVKWNKTNNISLDELNVWVFWFLLSDISSILASLSNYLYPCQLM